MGDTRNILKVDKKYQIYKVDIKCTCVVYLQSSMKLSYHQKNIIPNFCVDLQLINPCRPYNPSQSMSTQSAICNVDINDVVKICLPKAQCSMST